MRRCLQLAKLGAGHVAPNPMVGAVLVHKNRIIGEGYHQKHGEAHAEPNCIGSVQEKDRHLISESTLYVSLEPCVHFGKTPPCADLIVKNKIPKAVIGCLDPFAEVRGKGIEKLKAAGVEVKIILENECREVNKRFIIFHEQHRPYIILKWAETTNGKIATSPLAPLNNWRGEQQRLFITNDFTNRLVHKWRSEEAAILVGTNTASMDDPRLTTRLWPGSSPVRLVVDMNLKLPPSLKIFDQHQPTMVFNTKIHSDQSKWLPTHSSLMERLEVKYYQVTEDVSLVHQITNALHQLKIQSVIVEGGARLLQTFIDEGMWDEARIIKNEKLIINNGLAAPVLDNCEKISEEQLFSDHLEFFKRVSSRLPHHDS
jgi:diaminohydroxyphosphoribosylaminopyrimidine deaminase/5-amino-6-(5-phosphoribosylamino)uracil reductase